MDRLDSLLAEVEAEIASDLGALLDDSACERLLRANRLHDRTAVLLSRAIVEVEERKASDVLYGAPTARWLTATAKVSATTAGRRVKTAWKLRHLLDEVDAAWAAGLLTEDHVKVFHEAANPRIRDEIAGLQGRLIGLAQQYTFHHWRLLMANVVHELDQDGAFDPDKERERNTASFSTTLEGDCTLSARFDRVAYARFKHVVDARAQELFRHHTQLRAASGGTLAIPSLGCLRSLAMVELAEAGAAALASGRPVPGATFVLTPDLIDGTDTSTTTATTTDPADIDEPWADDEQAGDAAADHHTAATEPAPAPTSSCDVGATASHPAAGDPADPTEAADRLHEPILEDRDRDRDTPNAAAPSRPTLRPDLLRGWRAWTLDGLLLPGASPELAAHLCDATTGVILLDLDGNPLSMGRTRRLFQPHQRTALAIRDGGCVAPGCDRPPEDCNAHHVRFWKRDHGPTDVDAGVLLCPRDHGIPHRDGWDLFITTDGWPWFRPPTGTSFWGQRHGIQRTGPTPDQPGYVAPPSIEAAATDLTVTSAPTVIDLRSEPPPPPTSAESTVDQAPTSAPETRPPPSPGDGPAPPSPSAPPTPPPANPTWTSSTRPASMYGFQLHRSRRSLDELALDARGRLESIRRRSRGERFAERPGPASRELSVD